MRASVVHFLVVSLVLGAFAWSLDIHAAVPGNPAVAVDQAADHAPDLDAGTPCYDVCGHGAAHFTGLPAVVALALYQSGHSYRPLTHVARVSLTQTPPTPPPNC